MAYCWAKQLVACAVGLSGSSWGTGWVESMVDQKAETTANHLDVYWVSMTARTKVELLGYTLVGCWVVTTV